MAKRANDGDDDDDPLTQINVDVGPSSLISTIDSSARASQADTEPSTLEPGLSVRGLARSSGQLHVPGSVVAPGGRAPLDHDDEDDKTTGSIDARLLEAYGAARSVEDAIVHTAPSPGAQGPMIITPSEPFRVTSPQMTSPQITEKTRSSQTATPRRPAAPIPAAGRPPSADFELAEPTVKRAPYALSDAAFAETLQSNSGAEDAVTASRPGGGEAADADDAEDETATDAMGTKRSEIHEELSISDALPTEDEEEEETRTQNDVGRGLRAMDGGSIGSLPAATRDLVGLDEARSAKREMPPSSAGFPAAMPAPPPPLASPPLASPPLATSAESGPSTSGATIRMMFNASLGAVTINPPPGEVGSAPRQYASLAPSYAPSAPPPGLYDDAPRIPPPAALPTVRRPPTPRFDPLAKPKRSRTRRVFFFLVFVAAGGAGFTYRHRVTPWVMKHLPAAAREWIAPRPPPPPPPPPIASPDPSASASASPSASASASASGAASASASASPSASPSASAARPKKRPKK